jgi:hypothetical protein
MISVWVSDACRQNRYRSCGGDDAVIALAATMPTSLHKRSGLELANAIFPIIPLFLPKAE